MMMMCIILIKQTFIESHSYLVNPFINGQPEPKEGDAASLQFMDGRNLRLLEFRTTCLRSSGSEVAEL